MATSKPFAVVLLVALCGLAIWLLQPHKSSELPPPITGKIGIASTDGNRLAYLRDFPNPYYPTRGMAKLTTPQWLAEPGVEAAVVLSIDDMREPAKYEAMLRPALNRLKQIDGRAPVSIFANVVNVADPLLRTWRSEGLSFEVHTMRHPCPLLAEHDIALARNNVHECLDLLSSVPDFRPSAFRMPCCDSMNSLSPRFFSAIFEPRSNTGAFLTMDSSVFHLFTPKDPEIPSEVFAEGEDRFKKYLPLAKGFVNYIEDYPYPYVIGGNCWELPSAIPSDWEAQFYHGKGQPGEGNARPETLADMKAGIDATVAKQGLFTLCFHPHGWIKPEQIVELIDHVVAKHGDKVKFLTLQEVGQRLNQHLLGRSPLRRASDGGDNGVRVLDLNNDGFMDVVCANAEQQGTRLWDTKKQGWRNLSFPIQDLARARLGVVQPNGSASLFAVTDGQLSVWHFQEEGWTKAENLASPTGLALTDANWTMRDLDADQRCELIAGAGASSRVFRLAEGSWVPQTNLPEAWSSACRLIDLDADKDLDLIYSNQERFAVYRQDVGAWIQTRAARRGEFLATEELPSFVADDGFDNGVWFHGQELIQQNEHTAELPNVVDRRKFAALLEPIPASAPKGTGLDAKSGLASIKVPPGFRVEIAAAEPEVMDPIDLAWGADGKLWVVEMADYPLGIDGKGMAGGRVRFLRDEDGDGRYEKSALFLDGLSNPTSVMAWGAGALVLAAPELFYAEDSDGDGRADKRETLLSGFTEGNQQHRANGMRWGLDGWIYLANGDSGGTIHSTKTKQSVELAGRDLRFRPDSGAMETITGQTQFVRAQNDVGQWFGCNNSFPIYHFVLPDEYLRRNPHFSPPNPVNMLTEGNPPVFPASPTVERFNDYHTANRITSACGIGFYSDDWLGEEFRGNAFIAEPVHNLVMRQVLTSKGPSFSASRAPSETSAEFFASRDPWSRPTSVHTGPDGALYVVDMYRQIIEHPEWIPHDREEKLDLRAGHERGRIYRVVREGKARRAFPRLDQSSPEELAGFLAHPNGTVRDLAQQLLLRKGGEPTPALKALLTHADGRARLLALSTLEEMAKLPDDVVNAALEDADSAVRALAIRLSEKRPMPLVEKLRKLAADQSDAVVLRLALALGSWKNDEAGKVLADLALRRRDDPYLRAAISSSALPHLVVMIESALAAPTPPADLLAELADFAAGAGDQAALARLIAAVPKSETPLAWHYASFAGDVPEAAKAEQKSFEENVGLLARKEDQPVADRQAALEFLSKRKFVFPTNDLASLVRPSVAPELQKTGLELLAQQDSKVFAQFLIEQSTSWEPAVAEIAHGMIRTRPDLAKKLIVTAESLSREIAPNEPERDDDSAPDLRQLTPEEKQRLVAEELIRRDEERRANRAASIPLNESLKRILRNHQDLGVRDLARRVMGEGQAASRQSVVERYADALTSPGNRARGKAIFTAQCTLCHQLENQGTAVGPDLSSLSQPTRADLLTAILDPNQAIEDKFLAYTITTKEGMTHIGMISSQAGESLNLRMVNGAEQSITRPEVAKMESTGRSLMPEGFEESIDPEQMADLLAYLTSARSPRKSFPRNEPATILADASGRLELPSTRASIHGPSVVFGQRYLHLTEWKGSGDLAVWTIQCPTQRSFRVLFDYSNMEAKDGNEFLLTVGDQDMTASIGSTETENAFQLREVGEIKLGDGLQEILLRPKPGANVSMDLRRIVLEPR